MRPLGFRRKLVVLLAVCGALALFGGYAAAEQPAAKVKKAASAPGDVISAEPFTAYLDQLKLIPMQANAWKILYRSTSALGEPIDVSGSILVPKSAWPGPGPRPIISYAIGTHGMGDQCAPSYKLPRGTENEAGIMNTLLQQGWAVAVTDYEKLGTPGVHTYTVGISQGHVVLDAARAAMRLSGAGLSPDAPVGLWGYSQGGQSTAWAAQQAASYAPELAVKGAAPGGVPADLISIVDDINGGPFSGLMFAAALGHDSAYPELDLETYLNDAGRAAMEDGKNLCVDEAVAKYSFKKISDYTTSNPLDTPAWQARLNQNRLGGGVKPAMPVYLFHGLADELVPYDQAAVLRTEWCGAGATVQWQDYPGEHVTAYVEAVPVAMLWMRDRFAGTPAPTTC
ncbi:MAG: lipase family protein [Micromonosporaceae bacterium]